MNISIRSKTGSHVRLALAVIALVLTTSVILRAADDKKDKNKGGSQPAAQKPPKVRASSSSSTSGGSGKTGKTGGSASTGGSSTTGSAGGSGPKYKADRKTYSTGTSNPTGSTGGSNPTASTTGGSNPKYKADRRTLSTGGSTGSTGGSSNPTGSTGGSNPKYKAGKGTYSTGASNPTIGATGSPTPKREVLRVRDGSEIHRSLDGRVREVHTHGMVITHYSGVSRRVVVERADRSVIVVNHAGFGYVQRPFAWRGQPYYGRTYYYYGRPYAAYYRGYPYHGIFLAGYAPYSYWRPAFYGWAYNPWYRPIRFGWGWGGSPWYGYYGYYFSPYSVYPSASFWLTDYLIASSLQLAYQERLQAQQQYYSAPATGQVVLTPDVKQAIADEVQRQLALERAESQTVQQGGDVDVNSSGLPRIFAETSPSHPHVFVVSSPLQLTDTQGQECLLTQGDVLRLTDPTAGDATSAYLTVIASKNRECVRGTTVSVGLADLQEMDNQMRTTIDRGLQDLQAHQGGLPTPPAAAIGTGVQASFVSSAPPADPNVSSELQQQAQAADAAEQGVLSEAKQQDPDAGTSDASTKQPLQIVVGQTTDDVRATLGNPSRIARVGVKEIYFYPDMKITFMNGKVTNVE